MAVNPELAFLTASKKRENKKKQKNHKNTKKQLLSIWSPPYMFILEVFQIFQTICFMDINAFIQKFSRSSYDSKFSESLVPCFTLDHGHLLPSEPVIPTVLPY